ncbi:MAG TPA: hypothetical protein VFK47_20470 [Ktedonobacteraceae bacterium]|nr:hypothetical protein [Ktedonobacteraceae bacterium]
MKVQPKKNTHWLRWVLIAVGVGVVVLLVASGVGYVAYRVAHDLSKTKWSSDDKDDVLACGAAATQVALGSPYQGKDNPAAYFTTDGSDILVSARHFEHGGIFDPKTGRTGIWIGGAATPPSLNEQSSQVANTKLELTVQEGKHKMAQLPAGRYWLWTSTGGDIVVASCGQISGQQPNGKAAEVIQNVYHGGACDDQAYYTKHERECAVQ